MLHKNDVALPLEVNETKPPTQTGAFVPPIETVGLARTVNVLTAVLEQPVVKSFPVNEYVVFTEGVTAIEFELLELLHVYVSAPVAERVAELPAHKVELVALITRGGKEFTVT